MNVSTLTRYAISTPIAANLTFFLLCMSVVNRGLAGQEEIPSAGEKNQFKVQTEREIPIPEQQRKMVIQRVSPPVLPAPPEAKPPIPLDPEVVARRREWWLANGPLETRILSVRALIYDNGISLLRWSYVSPEGEWKSYEAWSGTDFSSLWIVPDFELNRTRYFLFPSVMSASLRFSGARPPPGPLVFEKDSPGYILIKGDPTDARALEPINALHQIYKEQGLDYAVIWTEQKRIWDEDAEWRKANPPVPQDTVIQFWPKNSRRHATAPKPTATPTTAPASK